MTATRISHAACSHAANKVARAKCRRDRARVAATIVSPIIAGWDAMKTGPKELEMAPIVVKEMRIVGGSIDQKTWREAKGETSTITIAGETLEGEITGWSAKLIQIRVNGKLIRKPAADVEYATWGKMEH